MPDDTAPVAVPTTDPPPAATSLEDMARAAAKRHGIPASWFVSLIGKGEGGFKNPEGVSPKGARGVGQLMPRTAEAVGVENPDDPSENIEGSARYAAQMWRRYKGNARLAAAAYNAGPGNADKHGENWDAYPKPEETKPYVERVALPSADEVLDSAQPLPSVDSILDAKPRGRVTPLAFAKAAAEPGAVPGAGAAVREMRPGYESYETLRAQRAAAPAAALAKDITPPTSIADAAKRAASMVANPMGPVSDLLGVATAPIMAGVDLVAGRPVEAATGGRVSAQTAGDVASVAVPVAGEVGAESALAARARAAGASVEAMRANEAARAAAPRNTLSAATGGPSRATSGTSYYRGMPDAAFNRAAYSDTLSEIGEAYPSGGPVGNKGVSAVRARLSEAYDEIKPQIRLKDDAKLTDELSSLRTRATAVGAPQAQQFESILNNDVLTQFQKGGMDGATFKRVESDVKATARRIRSAAQRNGDRNQERLADLVDDTAASLRSAVDRASPKGAVARLRDIDRAQAKLYRLEGAAARNAGASGIFSPMNMLQEARSEDGESAFAQGKAMFQPQAQAAYRAKPSLAQRAIGGAIGTAVGSQIPVLGHLLGPEVGLAVGANYDTAVNLARQLLARNAAGRVARVNGPNYLKRIDQRVLTDQRPRQ